MNRRKIRSPAMLALVSLCLPSKHHVLVQSFSATRLYSRTRSLARLAPLQAAGSRLYYSTDATQVHQPSAATSSDGKTTKQPLELTAPHDPAGDQPQAIQQLVQQLKDGDKYSILRGITGTGKTLVMANVIHKLQKSALILCHNKTLAAQLAREMRSMLSKDRVQLFVSYYKHYVPESYSETTSTYRAKKSSISDEIDALRHLATKALVQHDPVVVVASISCIYGLGLPAAYLDKSWTWEVGSTVLSKEELVDQLTSTLYVNVDEEDSSKQDTIISSDLERGQFQLLESNNGLTSSIWPPSDSFPMRLDFSRQGDGLLQLTDIFLGHNSGMSSTDQVTIFPAKHHIAGSDDEFQESLTRIQEECDERVKELLSENKDAEAARIQMRVAQDLQLLRETGTCPGVENYSRHLGLRGAGVPPNTLLDYFGEDFLLFVDESHVTNPQIKAMYAGDRARKQTLVKHGYRLPSALDNRPLQEKEFWHRIPQTVFVSATPGDMESELSERDPVEMTIRPTFVADPDIEVRSPEGQLENLVEEINKRIQKGERTLAMTLTKRDAEDLAGYLLDKHDISASYIHSGLNTHERSEVLTALQKGDIDCLVGVNLLREGLDLPQVSLVAILGADCEGFLRSETALLQTIGRAARHQNGKAILYARCMTNSMKACIDATRYRRTKQLAYNEEHGKIVRSTRGSSHLSIFDLLKDQIAEDRPLEVVGSRVRKNVEVGLQQHEQPVVSVPINLPQKLGDNSAAIITDHIPSKPGIYMWKNEHGDILYIGKAKRLRSRVKSYLSPGAKHTQRIRVMLRKAANVEFIVTPTDRDALLLEQKLIQHHQPLYNVLLKDDETYPLICATIGDSFPQFTIVPRRDEESHPATASKYMYFGPYPHLSEIRRILDYIEETYELRVLSFEARQAGSSNAEALKQAYFEQFQKALNEVFLQSKSVVKSDKEPSPLFDSEYNSCRDVVGIGWGKDSSEAFVHVMQLRDGLVNGQFSYTCKIPFSIESEDDYAEIIQTTLEEKHYPSGSSIGSSFFPKEVLTQYPVEGTEIRRLIRSGIRSGIDSDGLKGPIKVLVRAPAKRGARKATDNSAIQLAVDNAQEVAMTKFDIASTTSGNDKAMEELTRMLSLQKTPLRIECYDISHTQGQGVVGSRVVFINGEAASHLYRRFNIRHDITDSANGVDPRDDYFNIEQLLERRFRRVNGVHNDTEDPWSLPDLVVIDGGKGQLAAAARGMAKAGVFPTGSPEAKFAENGRTVPLVSLAKENEELFAYAQTDPVNESNDSAALLLLRALRDESHRFALWNHRKRRSKLNGL